MHIGVRSGSTAELLMCPGKMQLYMKHLWEKCMAGSVSKQNGVLRYPTSSMAQLAGMSTEAFTDHYFNVCNLDYSKMSKAMNPG